jgi:XTP/dITP diphosphohydrolase
MKATLASANRHKLDELQASLPGWEIELLDVDDHPPEDGDTYYANALLKARFGRGLIETDRAVLGEDSGIECDALNGEPGLHSARWAPGRDQADALLERLDGEENRRAQMISELVYLAAGGSEQRGSGVLRGTLAPERRGHEGFGYDPIFIPDGYDQTVAELGDDWKRDHSHRAQAARALESALRV